MPSATPPLPILDELLTADQQTVLDALLWHVTREDDHGPVTTWPTWDHVKYVLRDRLSGPEIDHAAATLPQLDRPRYPYTLIWRSDPGASQLPIQPQETVGLTMAGLLRVDHDLAGRLATLIAGYAEQEETLPPNPTGVREGRAGLNEDLEGWVLRPDRPKAGRVPMNVRSAAEILQHEYRPLVVTTGYQWIYEVILGSERFAAFRGVTTPEDYIRALLPAGATTASPADQRTNMKRTVTSERRSTVTPGAQPSARPSVFIGSSAEGLPVAEALQRRLDHAHEVTIWSQGVFVPGGTTLGSLVEQIQARDFAIFVVDADDTTLSREQGKRTTRDNVIFELGLFMGAIGPERCFMVYDRDQPPDLPTDLQGINPAPYRRHSNGALDAPLGASASSIAERIKQLGLRGQAALPPAGAAVTHPFEGASGDPLEALQEDIRRIRINVEAQGWKVRTTDTALRLWDRKGQRLPTFAIGEPTETRTRLRDFTKTLRSRGLRVNRRVRAPVTSYGR